MQSLLRARTFARKLCLTLVALVLLLPGVTLAVPFTEQSRQIIQVPLDNLDATQPVDVVVLLDDSGSMATCWPWPTGEPPFFPPCRAPSFNPPSDPDELRYSAARLLLQLADEDDRLAVVRFDSVADGVGALGSLQRVGDAGNRRQLATSLQAPDDYFRRGYTRMDLGLELAANILQNAREPGRDQYILLLTDGEPNEPDAGGGVKQRIADQFDALRDDGVLVFPVVLCNAASGCSGDFLREQFAEYDVNEAASAQELLRVFSEIFTRVKPDRSVITERNGSGELQVQTRLPHAVRNIAYVTPRNGLTSVRRDGEPAATRSDLDDPNIDVNLVDAENLAAGQWTAGTADSSGFAVVQADSYPQLVSPPPSIASSPASVRYYPAGKSPLLIARGAGPGANEPLLYNGQTAMQPFGNGGLRALLPSDDADLVQLQLGDDADPLQLLRSFRLEPRADLPQVEVFYPRADDPGLLEDGHAQLQVGFSGGAKIDNLAATAYVFEAGEDGAADSLVYQQSMQCSERLCTDTDFLPEDGHAYDVTYVMEGQMDGVRFSDWAKTSLELAPAVLLRGLPANLDLAQMPAGGWPLELSAGTLDEIGALAATISLREAESGEPVPDVTLDFNEDVPEADAASVTLRVDGLETLRPGEYVGEIALAASSPAGRPMDVRIRPGRELPVTFSVPRPVARIDAQQIDFGEILFDTSPNFRLNQEAILPIAFEGEPFKITASLAETTCDDLTVAGDDLRQTTDGALLPLQLRSSGPVDPGACRGAIVLTGPNGDYDVYPSRIDWSNRVASVEWSLVSGDLDLGDLQDAGDRIEETLLIRFNGKTPFVVQRVDLNATGASEEGVITMLTSEDVDLPPVEVSGPPNEVGLYEVPVAIVARRTIPHDALRGTFYDGELALGIVGLEGDVKSLDMAFRSPSVYQRYLAPFVEPVFSMPWVLCTGPLLVLMALVFVARFRGRGLDDNEIEEAASAATVQMATTTPAESSADMTADAAASAAFTARTLDSAWGRSEWGNAWSSESQDEAKSAAPAINGASKASGANGGDPWKSSW